MLAGSVDKLKLSGFSIVYSCIDIYLRAKAVTESLVIPINTNKRGVCNHILDRGEYRSLDTLTIAVRMMYTYKYDEKGALFGSWRTAKDRGQPMKAAFLYILLGGDFAVTAIVELWYK